MTNVVIPQGIKILTEIDICQGNNEDGCSCDIMTWIDKLFEREDERILVQKTLARSVGILSHSLIKWNDSTPRKVVAETFNKVVKQLQGV